MGFQMLTMGQSKSAGWVKSALAPTPQAQNVFQDGKQVREIKRFTCTDQ